LPLSLPPPGPPSTVTAPPHAPAHVEPEHCSVLFPLHEMVQGFVPPHSIVQPALPEHSAVHPP